jgi:hypothetical protein
VGLLAVSWHFRQSRFSARAKVIDDVFPGCAILLGIEWLMLYLRRKHAVLFKVINLIAMNANGSHPASVSLTNLHVSPHVHFFLNLSSSKSITWLTSI